MSRFIFLAVLLVACPANSQRYGAKEITTKKEDLSKKLEKYITVEHDKFKNTNYVSNKVVAPDFLSQSTLSKGFSLKALDKSDTHLGLFLLASFNNDSKSHPNDPIHLTIGYDFYGSWAYLKCHSLDFLVDGKPIKVSKTSWDGETKQDGVVEYVKTTLTLSQLELMASAKTIEGRLCGTEFVFDERHFWLLNRILQEIKK